MRNNREIKNEELKENFTEQEAEALAVALLKALNNKKLDIDSPDDFLDENIYGYVRIPKTQDTVRNFICVTVDDIEEHRYNEVMKYQNLQFTVICHLQDMKTGYGIEL